MRPVRVTNTTGTSVTVPLDVYCVSQASVAVETAGTAAQLQYTLDNVFDTTITPAWFNLGAVSTGAPGVSAQAPLGARGVRCTGMVPADVLTVSQQSIT